MGSTPTIDDLVRLIEDLAYTKEQRPDSLLDPEWLDDSSWPQDPELLAQLEQQRMSALYIASQYHDAQALDNLRKIAYDPNWNPAEEEQLLRELDVAIGQVTRTIIGVDIGFVQDGLRAFHSNAKKVHDWRMELKASIDAIEVEMLARRDEEKPSLWWLAEIPLSILFEPLDWLFTVRDVLQGDMLALVGFLPFVPSALRHIADAGRYLDNAGLGVLQKLDELREVMPKVDDIEAMLRGLDLNAYPWTDKAIPNPDLNLFEEVYNTSLFKGHVVNDELATKLFGSPENFEKIIREGNFGVVLDYLNDGKAMPGRFSVEFLGIYDADNNLIAVLQGTTIIDDKTGKIAFGVSTNVDKMPLLSVDKMLKLEGGKWTHYHPHPSTFSLKDVGTFLNFKLAEMRVFTDDPTFVLRPNFNFGDLANSQTDELFQIISSKYLDDLKEIMKEINATDVYDVGPEKLDQIWSSIFGDTDLFKNFLDSSGNPISFTYLRS